MFIATYIFLHRNNFMITSSRIINSYLGKEMLKWSPLLRKLYIWSFQFPQALKPSTVDRRRWLGHVKNIQQVIKISSSFIFIQFILEYLLQTDLDEFARSIYILLFVGVGKDLGCTRHMSLGTGRVTGHYPPVLTHDKALGICCLIAQIVEFLL